MLWALGVLCNAPSGRLWARESHCPIYLFTIFHVGITELHNSPHLHPKLGFCLSNIGQSWAP